MSFKLKLLKALCIFIGAVFPAVVIYILSFFTSENAIVGSSENIADTVFSMLSILSYTGPFALVFAIIVLCISGQTFGKIFDLIYKKYS